MKISAIFDTARRGLDAILKPNSWNAQLSFARRDDETAQTYIHDALALSENRDGTVNISRSAMFQAVAMTGYHAVAPLAFNPTSFRETVLQGADKQLAVRTLDELFADTNLPAHARNEFADWRSRASVSAPAAQSLAL